MHEHVEIGWGDADPPRENGVVSLRERHRRRRLDTARRATDHDDG
jgi:hypothetical protein